MTRRTLILHAGLHKTGTTALQNAMAANRDALAAQGVTYPEMQNPAGKRLDAHFLLAHAVAGQGNFDLPGFLASLRDTPADHKVLISAEAICRHVEGASYPARYSPAYWSAGGDADSYWARREAYLVKLRDVLKDYDIRPVLTLRRQDKVAESLYFSFVYSMGIPDDFSEFLVGRRHWFDFDRQVALFRRVFGQVETLSYEDALEEGIAETFCKHILGVAPRGIAAPRARVSSDPRTVLWMRKRNAAAGAALPQWRRRALGFRDWLGAEDPFADDAPRVGYWRSQAARDAFLARYGVRTDDPVDPPARLDAETDARITALFEAWERAKA